MSVSALQAAGWYRATTLAERAASPQAVNGDGSRFAIDAERAECQLARWRDPASFETDAIFADRLAVDGLDEPTFRRLLGEPVEAVQARFAAPPAWLARLSEAFTREAEAEPIPLPTARPESKIAGILVVAAPLIRDGLDRLRRGIADLSRSADQLPFDPDAVLDVLYGSLSARLLTILGRTIALDLNVARLQGVLAGETAEERFASFLERLSERANALALLEKYPVLARQLVVAIDQWVTTNLEFLQRLVTDWEAIRAALCPDQDPGALTAIDGGAGDSHRGGRSVLALTFRSGFRLVYKPRSLAVEAHFQRLLRWLNDLGARPAFRTLTVLDRGSYGWVEFVVAQPCGSTEEVGRFYERQGGYLALLYALAATDMHRENLIAAGEHPVLLDLESLFHPRLHPYQAQFAEEIAATKLVQSTLGIGLLPQRIWANRESAGIDVSGLGAVAGQLLPHGAPRWKGAGTDELRFVRERMPLAAGQNRPTLNGADVETLDWLPAIEAGFTNTYRLLLNHRAELLADDGPIARFAGDEVRVILRATLNYAILLNESWHPDVLRDALDRDRLLDRLWGRAGQIPYLRPVIPAERADVEQGDIPYFTTRSDSRDLWTSAGERVPAALAESGLALARRRITNLSEEDRQFQVWLIQGSLLTLAQDDKQAISAPARPVAPAVPSARARLVAAASAVGERLAGLALRGNDDASWIGLSLVQQRHWTLAPVGVDLYDGLPGIALFFAHLGAIAGDEQSPALARTAVTSLRRQVEYLDPETMTIGGYAGWGGLIYTLTRLSLLWDEPALLDEATAMVEQIASQVDRDREFDIITGAAGAIVTLSGLYRQTASERLRAVIVQCAERLLALARPMSPGIGWSPVGETAALTGMSHGAGGVAWALLEAATVAGDERFRAAALEALAYERSLFSPADGNWHDSREAATYRGATEGDRGPLLTSWCHGAPGIGLARVASLPLFDDGMMRAEIETAVRTTATHGFGRSHSLCHGDLGNLELLLQASRVLDDPAWEAEVEAKIAMVLESIECEGWRCGNPLGLESPGLMTGLAGIGYQLLRLAEPDRVPSVLTLDTPIGAGVADAALAVAGATR